MPKTYNNLYSQIYDFKNLYLAYCKTRKCKRYRKDVLEFTKNLEENLINIQNHFIYLSYQPQPFKEFYIKLKHRSLVFLGTCNIVADIKRQH